MARGVRDPQVELVPGPARLWRVHQYQHGPLNPPLREGNPDKSWSRFDIAGFATLYGATAKQGAYEESLAYFRADDSQFDSLFDNDDVEAIDVQWENSGHMQARHVARQWRDVRCISSVEPRDPTGLRLIDVSHSTTIGFLRSTMNRWARQLPTMDPSEIDMAALSGQNRALTCSAAWWLQRLTLPDGTRPDGIRYGSRHGVNLLCFALWIDLGAYPAGTPVVRAAGEDYAVAETSPIEANEPALNEAARALQLTIH